MRSCGLVGGAWDDTSVLGRGVGDSSSAIRDQLSDALTDSASLRCATSIYYAQLAASEHSHFCYNTTRITDIYDQRQVVQWSNTFSVSMASCSIAKFEIIFSPSPV